MAVMLAAPYSFFEDVNGVPLNGGKIYTYAAGTTTPKATYTDYTEVVPAANPIILDSAGRAAIWITGSYKFIVKDANDVTLYTTDNVTAFSTSSTSSAGVLQPSGNLTLTTNDYGKTIVPNASNITLTLPALDTTNQGRKFTFSNISNAIFTIVAVGTNKIYYGTSYNNVSSIIITPGETIDIQNFDNNTWYVTTVRPSDVVKPIKGTFKNLKVQATSNTAITVTADEIFLTSTIFGFRASTVSLTLSMAGTGANGLDTGSEAANTWYAVYAIFNPSTTVTAGLLSLSATAPTLPTGYTYFARVGWVRNDGSSNLLQSLQYGRTAHYTVGTNPTSLPIINSGVIGSTSVPTYVASSISNFVPTTATIIHANITGTGGQVAAIAPNASYGTYASTTNPAYGMNATGTMRVSLILESTNIYYAGDNANNAVRCAGWEDNL